ncbi:hypothetical protein AVEN_44818-1 [Araneus ventricosus]|uniref:Uncharacterized protein n=1 Tax=Araneus ventricosus TaxID=182803 RepID=A0A4Y2CL77_ARAVE|nr:hypothetical protein AVEN_44818-1 [Araneus ventricosus]
MDWMFGIPNSLDLIGLGDLAARVAWKQRFCLDWNPATRLDHVEIKFGNPPYWGGEVWVGVTLGLRTFSNKVYQNKLGSLSE